MIRKLVNLIRNYDKIMSMIENKDKSADTKSVKEPKRYSLFNTPKEQLEYIERKMKGE